jgi:hypothetical protein
VKRNYPRCERRHLQFKLLDLAQHTVGADLHEEHDHGEDGEAEPGSS